MSESEEGGKEKGRKPKGGKPKEEGETETTETESASKGNGKLNGTQKVFPQSIKGETKIAFTLLIVVAAMGIVGVAVFIVKKVKSQSPERQPLL